MNSRRNNHDGITSYARRGASRMTWAQRRAYEALYDTHVISPSGFTPEVLQHFAHPDRPCVLELGSGMGVAVAQYAHSRAHINYLACEVYKPGVARLLWYIGRYNLANVKIIEDDCVPLLAHSRGTHSRGTHSNSRAALFDGVHIHFPDPWPKKRHHKRRLINPRFLSLLVPTIQPGGYLSIVTDNPHYAHAMLNITAGGLHNPYGGFAPVQVWRFTTPFEARAQREGRACYELFLRVRA